jgi:hypothetical protein
VLLPEKITIPRLSAERIQELRETFPSDLTSVGPTKPLGNYPLDALQFKGLDPEEIVARLRRKRGVTAYIAAATDTRRDVITVYDQEALQAVLDRKGNSEILRDAGWPQEATAFAKRTDAEWADYATQPALCGVIADAFSGQEQTIPKFLKRLETGDSPTDIDDAKILNYVERCSIGLAGHIADELNVPEMLALASRMTMRDLISCLAVQNRWENFLGDGQGGEFALSPEEDSSLKPDISPLLVRTFDYDPGRAVELVRAFNDDIMGRKVASKTARGKGEEISPRAETWAARTANGRSKDAVTRETQR